MNNFVLLTLAKIILLNFTRKPVITSVKVIHGFPEEILDLYRIL